MDEEKKIDIGTRLLMLELQINGSGMDATDAQARQLEACRKMLENTQKLEDELRQGIRSGELKDSPAAESARESILRAERLPACQGVERPKRQPPPRPSPMT